MDLRKKVREKALTTLDGANFTSLSGRDVARLFEIYDNLFFEGSLLGEIAEKGKTVQFKAHAREAGYASVVGFDVSEGYYLDIAPNVLNTILIRKGAKLATPDRLEVMMLAMESSIVYMAMMVWGYLRSSNLDDEIYGVNGKLFKCVLKQWFGRSIDDETYLSTVDIRASTPSLPIGRYVYWSNSCYLDSLITLLLSTRSDEWRKMLLDTNVDEQWRAKNHKVNICDPKSTIDTVGKAKLLAVSVQKQLKEDYESLTGNKSIRCGGLRLLMLRCMPKLKTALGWVMYSSEQIYATLANLFPGMLLKVPYQSFYWDEDTEEHVDEGVIERNEALLQVWDFMEDPFREDASYRKIRWDLYDSPTLVFYNGGTPRIKHFNKTGQEKGTTYAYGSKVKFDVVKHAKLSEYILNKRYRLVGVITLHGVDPKSEGGAHYTCYYLNGNDRWYHYDDTSSITEEVESLPTSGVWVESNGNMPSMYFYERVARERKEKKMVKKDAETKVYVVGDIEYQIKPSDDRYLLFVEDKSSDKRYVKKMDSLEPKPITKLTETSRVWRLDDDELERVVEGVREMVKG